ncbi:phage major capsid family protein [Paraburkholderia saeva]|uniref:Phage capsid-like C-terminal domain-containing protein n=1 Tax=Paraburkholderia saeva TaxID=2777537 RepID=A0A9N8X2F0_9BURK|nr:phage major capsid protein [Paraburkholderia saeva]CAG4901029.1 hypothetical protein LMG31841_02945 [Paraburkholderia saeva]
MLTRSVLTLRGRQLESGVARITLGDPTDAQLEQLELITRTVNSMVDAYEAQQRMGDLQRSFTDNADPGSSVVRELPPLSAGYEMFWRGATVIARGALSGNANPNEVFRELFGRTPDEREARFTTAEGGASVLRAVQSPAGTTTETWAQELTQQITAGFHADLAAASILGALDCQRFTFDTASKIVIPYRSRGAGAKNLQALFRKEGTAIAIGALSLASATLRPFVAGRIGTYSDELARHSSPNVVNVIRSGLIGDTAEGLDSVFLSATAGITDTAPGGLLAGLPAANLVPSSGATPAAIQTDLKGAIARMFAARCGAKPQWIMHPQNAIALSMLITATGQLAFPSMAQSRLINYPVRQSVTVPVDQVLLIDGNEVAVAIGAPAIDPSSSATLVELDTPPVPPVTDGAGAPGAPTRSLFQTATSALRLIVEADWTRLADGGVQGITEVTW